MKIKSYKIMFRILSYLSDKTNGAQFFVKYKLLLGTLIIGLAGSTASAKAQNKNTDTVPVKPRPERITCYKVAVPQSNDNTQEIPVKGTVIDQNGDPLIGTNILIKNTDKGVITDIDGKFSIKATHKDILVFSFVGFETIEIPVIEIGNKPIMLTESQYILCYDVVIVKTFPDDIYRRRNTTKKPKMDKMLYSELQTPPVSPVGNREVFTQWIEKNIRYSDRMKQAKAQGEVLASFTVDKKGKIKNMKIIDSFSPDASAEVFRLIASLGKWTPGQHNYKPVETSVTITVNFTLPEE